MQSSFTDRFLTARRVQAILILLLGVSFAIRLCDLGAKSLWSDEGLTLRRAEQPLGLVFENVNLIPIGPDYQDGSGPESVVRTPDLHPPLYFLLMHFWIRFAGKSEFALRFPSVVAATLALRGMYAFCRLWGATDRQRISGWVTDEDNGNRKHVWQKRVLSSHHRDIGLHCSPDAGRCDQSQDCHGRRILY